LESEGGGEVSLFEFTCHKHGTWQEEKPYTKGYGYCKKCEEEGREYNSMLTEKGFNWPRWYPRPVAISRLIDKGEG
jgi:hypothetical protein